MYQVRFLLLRCDDHDSFYDFAVVAYVECIPLNLSYEAAQFIIPIMLASLGRAKETFYDHHMFAHMVNTALTVLTTARGRIVFSFEPELASTILVPPHSLLLLVFQRRISSVKNARHGYGN